MTEAGIIAGRLSLEALSAAATQGEWSTGHHLEGNYLYAGGHHIACISSPEDNGLGGDSFIPGESPAVANAELCAALVNAYRSGALAPAAAVRQVLQERGE